MQLKMEKKTLIYRADANPIEGAPMRCPPKSLPQRPKGAVQEKVAERSEVGRGRSPCGIICLRAFFQENDLYRLSAKTQAFLPKSTFP